MRVRATRLLLLFLLVGLAGCRKVPPRTLNLMPAPAIYEEGALDPLPETSPLDLIPYGGILFATDRQPAEKAENFYRSDRGMLLRLGVGTLMLGEGDYSWEEARRITLQQHRDRDYRIRITGVEEYGILEETVSPFLDPATVPENRAVGGERFAEAVNSKLATSRKKDIYVYVHGFRVVFEDPLLVASEFWHFLGYDGVFIAYSWPSTPSALAYASDIETAQLTARNLRLFLTYLARETNAERIHVLGFSAGTRVVITTLTQFAAQPEPESLRMGHVILTGSDYDRHLFVSHIMDGLLEVPESLTIYESPTDQALRMSDLMFRRNRLGQLLETGLPEQARAYLRDTDKVVPIDVGGAKGSDSGTGHAYFLNSPWVSSDVLMLLMHDLKPAERGLVRPDEAAFWSFPPDYVQRLRRALEERGSG
jgi:esterase/lipase superfamily enzyme